jgi:hypothetical protein
MVVHAMIRQRVRRLLVLEGRITMDWLRQPISSDWLQKLLDKRTRPQGQGQNESEDLLQRILRKCFWLRSYFKT